MLIISDVQDRFTCEFCRTLPPEFVVAVTVMTSGVVGDGVETG